MTTAAETAYQTELRVLRLSMYTALAMAAVGVTFAYLANSEVILLDGMFNVILFVMVAFGLSISRWINQGPDKSYHFGYGGYEPFMILVRCALSLALMAFSAFGAIQTILRGGSQVDGNIALVYSVILGTSCATVAWIMYQAYKKTGWPTVQAEFLTWALNGVISGSTGIALFVAGLLTGTALNWVVPYADPILLLIMSALLLPPPLFMLKQSFFELVGKAPAEKLASQMALEELMPEGFSIRLTRALRLGRTESLLVRVACAPETRVSECDALREQWEEIARERFPYTHTVIVFSNREGAA